MNMMNATDVRKNWSMTLDSVVRDRPVYVKRTHDNVAIMDLRLLHYLLGIYGYRAKLYTEPDGSVTLSAEDLDLAVNAENEKAARIALAHDIKTYADDYYQEFSLWSSAPNRRSHVPYVMKALMQSEEEIEEEIQCQIGKRWNDQTH